MLAAHVEGGVRPEGWIFVGTDGPPHQSTVGYWWRKTLRDAGCKDIKLHDLRHFYASGLVAQRCDVVTVQRSLGHAPATTTLNHLLAPVADRRGSHPQSRSGDDEQCSLGNLADSVRTERSENGAEQQNLGRSRR